MIVEKILEYKKGKIRNYPVNANRASDAGHPCLKYLVLNRTRWQEKQLYDVGLQLVFDIGNTLEDQVLQDIRSAGIQVVEQQRPFSWPKYQITGTIDAKVKVNGGTLLPLEIKTMSPFVFNTVNKPEDMIHGKYTYLKKYPAQMQLYLLMGESEHGIMLLKNKVNGAMKEVFFDLDYEYAETVLKRIEAVNAHVAAGTLPTQEWDDQMCPDCPYVHISHPDREGDPLEMISDPELEGMLNRREALKGAFDEYKEMDEEIKEAVKGKPKVVCGNWLITGKEISRKAYSVEAGSYWQTKIKRL